MENRYHITITKEENRTYTFTFPAGCPVGEAYDSCVEILLQIADRARASAESVRQKQEGEDNGE